MGDATRVLVGVLLLLAACRASAQDIEPRSFSHAPVGVNFLIGGHAYTRGGVAFDTALPITNPKFDTSSVVVGSARVLDLWGKSGKFDVIVPYSGLSGTAQLAGKPRERTVDGLADPRFRLSVNFYGAPALGLKDFRSYHQGLILGASLQVSVPAGQYDSTKAVNLGSNRWWFKPEIGISKASGLWTLELTEAVTLFTDNHDFFNGHTRALIALRKRHPCLMANRFFDGKPVAGRGLPDIAWHGVRLDEAPWDDPRGRLLRFTLAGLSGGEEDLHVILNMSDATVEAELPEIPGRRWHRALDTARA